MVEKLLETAMLDSEQLVLKKETVDIVDIAEKVVSKYQILAHKKELSFSKTLQPCYANIDVFHFENVISNLIDNAIKYGGNQIEININLVLKRIQDGASKDIVKKIRAEKDKSNRNILKQKLPAICFSGTFTKRSDKAIKEHSGLILSLIHI